MTFTQFIMIIITWKLLSLSPGFLATVLTTTCVFSSSLLLPFTIYKHHSQVSTKLQQSLWRSTKQVQCIIYIKHFLDSLQPLFPVGTSNLFEDIRSEHSLSLFIHSFILKIKSTHLKQWEKNFFRRNTKTCTEKSSFNEILKTV